MAQREQVDHVIPVGQIQSEDLFTAYGLLMGSVADREKDLQLEHISHTFNCKHCDEYHSRLNEELYDALVAKKKWKRRAKKSGKRRADGGYLNTYGVAGVALIEGMQRSRQLAEDAGREFPDRFWLIDDKEKKRIEAFLK